MIYIGKYFKILLAVASLAAIVILGLKCAGDVLVKADEPAPADIIVVLLGETAVRVPEAAKLYQAGYAPKIVMVQSYEAGFDELKQSNPELLHNVEKAKSVGVKLGVQEEDFIILPNDADSTNDEAVAVAAYVREQRDIGRVILVTSSYHSRRSDILFNWALAQLDRDVVLLSCPSFGDKFDSRYWWRTDRDKERVLSEYMKLANFYLRQRWQTVSSLTG